MVLVMRAAVQRVSPTIASTAQKAVPRPRLSRRPVIVTLAGGDGTQVLHMDVDRHRGFILLHIAEQGQQGRRFQQAVEHAAMHVFAEYQHAAAGGEAKFGPAWRQAEQLQTGPLVEAGLRDQAFGKGFTRAGRRGSKRAADMGKAPGFFVAASIGPGGRAAQCPGARPFR